MSLASPVACLIFCLHEIWVRHPAYHFFPLPVVALFWFSLQACRQSLFWDASSPAFKILTWLHLILAVASFFLISPFLAGLSFFVATLAFAVLMGNSPVTDTPRWSFPALALFLIPPPLRIDEIMHQCLAGLATRLSEVWLTPCRCSMSWRARSW